MDTNQAQISTAKINNEIVSLNPSALISLFEIDISDIAFDNQVTLPIDQQVFRFHNHIKLSNSSIYWQGNEYSAAPIAAEGFETNSKGTLPVPRLTIGIGDGGIILLSLFKQKMKQFGDLTGAKVTRIRTFAKFLSVSNFPDGILPAGFQTDEFAEFPRDIYYIDRKSNENKNGIQFELASVLDIEGVKLPGRIVSAKRCTAIYRSPECSYSSLPVGTDNDELITDILGVTLNNRGVWSSTSTYNKGDYVYTAKNGINYYFVAKINNVTSTPPNPAHWISEACSKGVKGCRLRFGGTGFLPMNSFVGCDRVR